MVEISETMKDFEGIQIEPKDSWIFMKYQTQQKIHLHNIDTQPSP
jgi:hypothetical protein